MDYLQNFRLWKTSKVFDDATRAELNLLDEERDAKEIEDRFYQDLEFGTAGLRGIMGAGTNRMNKYTVGKASLGFGKYLLSKFGEECKSRGVVICCDTRNNSKEFCDYSAAVFSALNIKVYVHSDPRPIPVLSYSIKKFHAVGGVMITASHNPKEYNGYKAYDENGCQLVPPLAKEVTKFVNAVSDYGEINFRENPALIEKIDITDEFVNQILTQSRFGDAQAKANLKVVYTPLHGTGLVPTTKALAADGFTNVELVREQSQPDGNFSTVHSPNPEDRRALELGISLAKQTDADIVLGTDPDCDRVGIAVKTNDGYTLFTGNQTGSLLMDYVLGSTDLSAYKKPAVLSTIVTSELGVSIAKSYGVSIFLTLTGFKFIGEKMQQFEEAKKSGDHTRDYDFLFGYEESYGSLTGTHAQDKDAVTATMLICEMAAKCKANGMTLIDKLNELYRVHGYYLDTQDSYTLSGKDGLEKIASMMNLLRSSSSPFENTSRVIDYINPVPAEEGFGNLPTANVIKYVLDGGSWVVVRPSGTEPKIKIYYSIREKDEALANKKLENIKNCIHKFLGL